MARNEINTAATARSNLFGATRWNELLVCYVEALEMASHNVDKEKMTPLLEVGARNFADGEDELKQNMDKNSSTR